ncbi:MAG: Bug family tripartite tricarboxylate transporter substrate binding protein, partial [Pigmentiphaga sp.]
DALGRTFTQGLRTQSQRASMVINRGGAGGVIGTTYVARAPADGLTLLLHAHPPYGTAPLFMKDPAYDPRESLVPVTKVGEVPMVLVTSGKNSIENFSQLKQYVSEHPDKANYVSSGVGSPGQIYTEMLKAATGLEIREIPYANPAQGQMDVISGEVLASMISFPAAKPHLQSGALKPLLLGSAERADDFPELPTMAEETGDPGFRAVISYAFFAPAGTPEDVISGLYRDLSQAYHAEELQDWLAQNGVAGEMQQPEAFRRWLQADLDGISEVVRAAKLTESGNDR